MGHGISFLADGGGVAVLVVLIQPHVGHIGCLLDFSGFFLAERFVFQQGGQLALVDGDGLCKPGLLAVVVLCYPLPQVVAAQVGGIHDGLKLNCV